MEIILNKCFGGAGFSKEFCAKYGVREYDVDALRTNKAIIDAVKEFGEDKASDSMSRLFICHIPDEASDWELNEYDGIERVTYVVDGLINHV